MQPTGEHGPALISRIDEGIQGLLSRFVMAPVKELFGGAFSPSRS